jgi:hypothetical protein
MIEDCYGVKNLISTLILASLSIVIDCEELFLMDHKGEFDYLMKN